MSRTTAVADDTATIGPGDVFVPRRAHRKPSTTPTMGLMPYHVRHGSFSRLLGYAIGVANSQTWVRNGTMYRTSRKCTLSAESQSPTPNAVTSASRRNKGSQTTFVVGVIL